MPLSPEISRYQDEGNILRKLTKKHFLKKSVYKHLKVSQANSHLRADIDIKKETQFVS